MRERKSPLGGRRPSAGELAQFATVDPDALEDVLPDDGRRLRLLIVGINPGLWTAAVNAPFARPGNRFWPSLHLAGLTAHLVDASVGLRATDERALLDAGIGITNLVGRATVRADELTKPELRDAGVRLIRRVQDMRPAAVAIAGITAYRTAFNVPKAKLGKQDADALAGWPKESELWVVPQPSGLNAHENVASLAEKWRAVWESSERR